MPTVVENRLKWSEHKWDLEGHEWSPGGSRAGTELLWWRSIRPRVQALVPAGTILEIAPGFGRWTSYLLDECERLVGVDVTERCVDVCRDRFAGSPAEFWVNDGESLPMTAPESIDLVFSFDSLVHVEAPQIRAYLRELARKLKPGAAGFLHHSNLGAYARRPGAIPSFITKRHWRAASMSARVFREACRDAGLICVSQEVINWIGRGAKADRHRLPGERIPLTDCFSTFTRPPTGHDGPTRVYVNRRFVDEWRQLLVLSTLYGSQAHGSRGTPPRADEAAPATQRGGPLRVLRRAGVAGTFGALSGKIAEAIEPWRSRAREEATGRWFAWREPVARRLAGGECPDCGATLRRRGDAPLCSTCQATFVLA